MNSKRLLFLAEYYEGLRVTSVEVVKETERQYQVDSSTLTKIFGKYPVWVSRRISKDDRRVFSSFKDALEWGAERAARAIEMAMIHEEEARKELASINKKLKEM